MRLIDADHLKKWIIDRGLKYQLKTADILDQIDRELTFLEDRKQGEWIPISERLPEETGEYLTTTMYGDVFCDHWQSCNFDRTEIVIAWMPLPKPYKAGEQE